VNAVAAAGLAVLILAAPVSAHAELHVVTVYAHDTGFEAPARVPSGATTFRFVNRGWEPHRMLLLRLADAMDEAALRSALPLGERSVAGIASLGGTGVQRGEGSEQLSVALHPGRYALVCDVHDRAAEIHELSVLDYEDAVLPAGDWSAVLHDDGVRAPAALAAGARWLRIENRGTLPYSFGFGRLRPRRSADEARAWLRAPSGPAPWLRVGGTAALSPGEAVLIEVSLSPGDYVLFATSPDGSAQPDGFWHALAVRQEH
jgi:hypothetical protein